jgi:hypothetical protein
MIKGVFMKYLILALFLSFSQFSIADNFCGLEDQLSEQALQALMQAEKSKEYKVNIMLDESVTPTRYFVILGEAHVKTKKASKIGIEVLKHFPLRGIEGVPLKEFEAVPRLLKYAVKIRKPIQRITGLQDSTIKDAMDGFVFRKNDGKANLSFKNSQVQLTSRDSIEQIEFKDFIQKIEETYQANPDQKVIQLKTNFNILCGQNNFLLDGLMQDYKKFLGCFESIEYATPFASSIEMGKTISLKKFQYLSPKYIVQMRNDRMAKNIVSFLSSIQDDRPFLSVMGLAHNPGIMKLVASQSKFKKCE